MTRLLLFNKPFGVICKFSPEEGRETLADYIDVRGVYPAGRLDADSEGLVVLTDDGGLQHMIADPRNQWAKTYWVQVEGSPGNKALDPLRNGIVLKDGRTKPAKARIIEEPEIWPRLPPVRYRKSIPTTWLELQLKEGKNRQVRRMTAAAGFPTLRLVRVAIGPWMLANLQPGGFIEIDAGPYLRKR